MITVEPVLRAGQFRDFAALPGRLHAAAGTTDRHVPLLRSEVRAWYTGRHWFPGIRLWLARDGAGTPVGRVITHHSDALDDRLSTGEHALAPRVRAGLFGALEAADGDVVTRLLETAAQAAAARGSTHLFGPVTPLPNVTGGVVRAGFDRPGFMDGVWNPPFVPQALADAGFTPWGIADTWEVDVAGVPADRATAPTPGEWRDRGLTLRHPDRWRTGRLGRRILPVLNAAFAQLPYFTEISPAQMADQMSGLAAIMDPRLILLAEDPAGRVAGFVLVIPDPVDTLRAHDGRLGPRAVVDLLRRRRRDAVLIIQGTRPDQQGRGVLGLLIRQLYANLRAGGYEHLRVTFIGRDNPASAAVFARAGGRPLHELSFHHRELPWT